MLREAFGEYPADSLWTWPFEVTGFLGTTQPRVVILGALWTNAHLFAVVFRSHGNPAVFREFPAAGFRSMLIR